ncbi:protein white-like [Ptychodera flava]|uniref:protein white-like n=1 Tax=Ptychodera flava TaxID=63121 RepID=UPI00396A0B40
MHQPSSTIFQKIDNILMLSEGRCAYMGPRDELVNYLHGIGYDCPDSYNPADYFIELLSTDLDDPNADTMQTICDCFDGSNFHNKVQEVLHDRTLNGRIRRKSSKKTLKRNSESKYKNSWRTQFVALLWRCGIYAWRDRETLKARLCMVSSLSLVFGLAYSQIPYSQSGVRSIQGMLALMIYLVGTNSLFQTIRSVQPEAILFFREHFNGMYRTDAYIMAKCLIDIPVSFTVVILAGSVSYWMTGLNPEIERFFTYLLLLFIVALAGSALGFAISTACTSYGVAMVVAMCIFMPLNIFEGFYINVATIPVYLRWFEFLSYPRYGYEAISINQWHGYGKLVCDLDLNKTQNICLPDGDAILEMYSFYPEHFSMDVTMLVILAIVYQLTAFLLLLARTYLKVGHRAGG